MGRLETYTAYDFEGKISNLIERLQKIVKKHPNATISYSLDYGVCYYEGDDSESLKCPEAIFTIDPNETL